MLFNFPKDVFFEVLYKCEPSTIACLLCTCKLFIQTLDEGFWERYLNILYGKEFWEKANKRTYKYSLPYVSKYHEFQRLKRFESSYKAVTWSNEDYYNVWECQEKKHKRSF